MNNVVLIGMPGSGKSTCGVVLAKMLGFEFVDTDLLIVKRENKKLQEILNDSGVDYFAGVEEKVGESVDCQNTVIATGGSMVNSERAMEHLKNIGTVVYLKVPYEELLKRIKNFKTRGIVFQEGETFEDVFRQRTPLYEKYADITVDFLNDDIEGTNEKIIELLGTN